MLARNSLYEHLLDTYGTCDRDNGRQNDCYWGKDARGNDNGCLKVGWLGRACKHWRPVDAQQIEAIMKVSTVTKPE
jgi:hypothetical protein